MDTSTNLIWVWPWAFCLALLPWLASLGLQRLGWKQPLASALRLPGYSGLSPIAKAGFLSPARRWSPWWWVWLLLVIAAARPELQQPEIEVAQQSRELLLVVDVSGSMQELMDGRTRLDHVKQVVGDFVSRRSEDQLGLVVFGGEAYLYVPKTQDHNLLLQQLQGMQPGMAGPGTAIGDALGVALRSLRATQAEPAIVLLTDGANNAGLLMPEEALQMAATAGVKVHLVVVDLNPDPDLSRAIQATGGQVFSAFSRRELEGVYRQLDQLEPTTQIKRYTPAEPLGPWVVLVALLVTATLVRQARRRRRYA